MPIRWSTAQRREVQDCLSAHPAPSGRCLEAARGVLPVARARDADARSWKISPLEGYFVVPRQSVGGRWFHHYTVEVELHYVDALTGVSGTVSDAYLAEHWRYPERLGFTDVDLSKEER